VSAPYWTDGTVTLYLGDCLAILPGLPDCSIDAVITDPPYGLEFMGREWDTFKPPGARIRTRLDQRTNPAEGKSTTSTPEAYMAGRPFQDWCEAWARECLRVLKPGGHLLAFGGTRTWHRLTCAIEDAGFEIRDCTADLTGIDGPGLLWVYGSGFPKSLDVSKAIDKHLGATRPVVGRWESPGRGKRSAEQEYGLTADSGDVTTSATAAAAEGWGTALKPAWEPIAVARKPLAGTVAQNVLQHGTGALNIDGCRVDGGSRPFRVSDRRSGNNTYGDGPEGSRAAGETDAGRWPPNVVLGETAAAELDRHSGVSASRASMGRQTPKQSTAALGDFAGTQNAAGHDDSGGASRFFPVFRYEAKAAAHERPRLKDGTAHPTVKPVDLMAWLVRLVTPTGGTVLDPFAGSGTTAEACIVEGFSCLLIEKDPSSAELIKTRLSKPIQPVMFGMEAS
jgi:DNA modification methylase